MQVSRNDLCPCNSGKKYKKCCQEPVEAYTGRLLQAMGTATHTAAGLEIAHTLGLWCSLQLKDAGAPPDPALLGRLLPEAWAANGQDSTIASQFKSLLLGKEHLKKLRLPFNLLVGVNLQTTPAGHEGLLAHINNSLAPGFYDYAIYLMALSLRSDPYSDEELKSLLIGFSWALLDQDTRRGLVANLLDTTLTELAAAQQELAQLDLGNPANAGPDVNEKMRQFFAGHPSYDGFVSARILAEIEPAYQVVTGSGTLKIPFHAIAGGCYALCLNALDTLSETVEKQQPRGLEGGQLHQALRGALWSQQEYVHFIPLLREAIAEWPEAGQPEELAKPMHDLEQLLSGFFMSAQFNIIENLYLHCILNMVKDVPQSLPGVDASLSGFLDLCNPEVMEPYIQYLERQNQAEEAAHVRRQYQSWAPRINRKYAMLIDILPAGLSSQDLLDAVLR